MRSHRGFSLLEVLIAITIVAVALAALGQLFALSIGANGHAKTTTVATLLAIQKMEELRGLTWSFDAFGVPASDPRLALSPANALRENLPGFCDFLDRNGQQLGEVTTPPAGAIYLRRWSIEPVTDSGNVLAFQVLVTQRFNRSVETGTGRRRLPDEARLVTVKTRRAR